MWRAVARRVGEWHACLPVLSIASQTKSCSTKGEEHGDHTPPWDNIRTMDERRSATGSLVNGKGYDHDIFAPNGTAPNLWTVIHKWIDALPISTEAEKNRKDVLARELVWVADELGSMQGIDGKPFVFAHCDLLSGNVIVLPRTTDGSSSPKAAATILNGSDGEDAVNVGFIDYEYATAAPSAFDIANHFAEWGGFDCDFSVLPTRTQRRDFLQCYLGSYYEHLQDRGTSQPLEDGGEANEVTEQRLQKDLKHLFEQVDAFRGLPGFYWSIWALIQSMNSQIDFDYASYAKIRLSEYWAWKAEWRGSREKTAEMPLRERRWQEE